MKKPNAASTETLVGASALAMPREGGSYVRQKDGSLVRTEFTDHPPAAREAASEAPGGDAAPGANGQEG